MSWDYSGKCFFIERVEILRSGDVSGEGMSKKYCENCGEKQYNGYCTNCHEEIYIEEQYINLNMEVPKSIQDKCAEYRKEIKN